MRKMGMILLTAALSVCFASFTSAAAYPGRTVKAIVAFPAGGATDAQLHILQRCWKKYASKELMLSHTSGAGGLIGFAKLAQARPDGYVIGCLSSPHVSFQSLALDAPFTPDSFAYICQAVHEPLALAVRKNSPYVSFQALVQASQRRPRQLRIGLVGPMSAHHLLFLDLQKAVPGMALTSVFFKGTVEQRDALSAGTVDALGINLSEAAGMKTCRILNVAAEKRVDVLPDVPTLREQGVDVVASVRRGYVAPAAVSAGTLAELRSFFKRICQDPDYLQEMRRAGQVVEYMDGDRFAAQVKADEQAVKAKIRAAGLRSGKE